MLLDPALHGLCTMAHLAEVTEGPAHHRFAAVSHFAGDRGGALGRALVNGLEPSGAVGGRNILERTSGSKDS
jgi:hypothetical protein